MARRECLALSGLVSALLAGCGGGGDGGTGPSNQPRPVASVTVTPGSLSLLPTQTGTLTAEARDASGAVLSGRAITWSTSDAAVATVSAGLVTGVAPGTATMTATSEGKAGTATVTVSPVPVASVEIAPQAVTLYPTQTRQFTATAKDSAGGVLGGRAVVWSTSNGAVATISATGLLTVVGVGSVTASASVEGKTATAAVTVIPVPVASVSVSPASVELAIGGTGQLLATARDSANNSLPGRTVAWTTSNAAVATVSDAGLVTGTGVGSAQITATAEGKTGTASVGVKLFLITSVQPDTLREGQVGTIVGQGFTAAAGTPLLQIDGQSAAIGPVSNTAITFTVPSYDCAPTRRVGVSLAIGAATDSDSAIVRPTQAYFGLPVGQQTVISDPSAFCLQFDRASGPEEYVVGVTNAAASQTSYNLVSVVGRSGLGNPTLPLPTPPSGWRDPSADPQYQRYDRHRFAELRIRERERQQLAQLQATLFPRPSVSPSVMGQTPLTQVPAVGDIVPIRVAINNSACVQYAVVNTAVRVVSDKLIILEDLANPTGGPTVGEYQALAAQFDQQSYPTVSSYFGIPTDFDANGRVVAVFTKEVNVREPGVIAYVRYNDILWSRSACASSNDGEYYYFRVADPQGSLGPPLQKSDLLTDAPRTFAHELVHIISAAERWRLFGSNGFQYHERWINEGQANFAEEVVGFAVEGRSTGQNYGPTVALGATNPQGTKWYLSRWYDLADYFGFETSTSKVSGAPEKCSWMEPGSVWEFPCLGGRLIYGVPSSMFRWVLDRIGGSYPGGEQGFHRALVKSQLNGLTAVSGLSGMSSSEILTGWGAALYTDGRLVGLDPRLTFASWDLAGIYGSLVAAAQLQPYNRAFGPFSDATAVMSGSSSYHRLSGNGRPAASLRVRNSAGGILSSSMRMWVVRLR